MCGIAGYFNWKQGSERYTGEIHRMNSLQNHRGPDDSGVMAVSFNGMYAEEVANWQKWGGECDGFLGFVRLSVRDLSRNGHQPMTSPDSKVIISFNGEIYNSDDYRRQLISEGYRFRSSTDTEVVLGLYLKYGAEGMVSRLNGMFAISIVDLRLRKLFLFRDRMGIKPLYYVFTKNRFAYASEIKAFLGLDDFVPEIDYKNLSENLAFYKPMNNILLKGVNQIMPGEMAVIDYCAHTFNKAKFFDINKYMRPDSSEYGFDYWKEKGRDLLEECVNRQKVSDARIGCQLSGGIDSSVVTYYSSQRDKDPLKDSVSIIFDGKEAEYSEERYIDIVCEKADITAHKFIINEDYVLDKYESCIWHGDTVIGRPNSIGLYMLTQKAKDYVTVLLSGEGSDELLGGYSMFTQGKYVRDMLNHRSSIIVETVRNQPEQISSFAQYAVISQQKTRHDLCQKIYPAFDAGSLMEERIAFFDSLCGNDFDKQIKYALCTYLPELLLCQDKMSMANSIENRVPILDNVFIDFAFSIPEECLIGKRNESYEGKFLLKEICSELFGEEFAYRRKMGFGLPYYRYFQSDRFNHYFYDVVLAGARKRGIMNPSELEKWYEHLGQNSWGESELFWKACSFEVWCQMFIDGRKPHNA